MPSFKKRNGDYSDTQTGVKQYYSPYDIEDALKRLGLEHDEVSYGRNTGDWETQEEYFKRMSSSEQSNDSVDSSSPTSNSKVKELAKKGLKMYLKSCWNYFWRVAKGGE